MACVKVHVPFLVIGVHSTFLYIKHGLFNIKRKVWNFKMIFGDIHLLWFLLHGGLENASTLGGGGGGGADHSE